MSRETEMRVDGYFRVDGHRIGWRRTRDGKVLIVINGQKRFNIGYVEELTLDVFRVAFVAYKRGFEDEFDRLTGTPWETSLGETIEADQAPVAEEI